MRTLLFVCAIMLCWVAACAQTLVWTFTCTQFKEPVFYSYWLLVGVSLTNAYCATERVAIDKYFLVASDLFVVRYHCGFYVVYGTIWFTFMVVLDANRDVFAEASVQQALAPMLFCTNIVCVLGQAYFLNWSALCDDTVAHVVRVEPATRAHQ